MQLKLAPQAGKYFRHVICAYGNKDELSGVLSCSQVVWPIVPVSIIKLQEHSRVQRSLSYVEIRLSGKSWVLAASELMASFLQKAVRLICERSCMKEMGFACEAQS